MPFVLTRNRIIIVGIAGILVVLVLALFTGLIPGLRLKPSASAPIKLNVWGVFNSAQVFENMANGYRGLHSNVEINYRQFDANTYETDLVNALAAGNGPDIFMFQNTWLPKHFDKIVPLSDTQLPYANFRDAFPQVISESFAPKGIIYASPLYLDTLAMFYNKDKFDKNGIALPPKTWTDFKLDVQKLREVNKKTNEIITAGAAMGGSNQSINRATDLLNLLMLQSGTQMVSKDFTEALFAREAQAGTNPGLDSLNFYTSFANPASPLYTWNENLHYSVDNFAEGNAAIIFNYSHQIPILRAKNPFLNFGIAEVPQITGTTQPVNYANFWGLAVSNKSKNPAWAWNFILYATLDKSAAKNYFEATKRPPALKSLISENINDSEWGVFIRQALTARSWPQIDNNQVDNSFSSMVQAVISGRLSATDALKKSEDEITLLMHNKK